MAMREAFNLRRAVGWKNLMRGGKWRTHLLRLASGESR